eukprot:TRINITY_DN1340_c0_g1_i1.p1 TRINITY_DN1340_c0_g1~~TRINITY_DN1340_c0_g1_i1.p1  ORF type:complete len:303 (+),score=76.61 TRINITY_DN1340_c0_g1_i1:95-910(+)
MLVELDPVTGSTNGLVIPIGYTLGTVAADQKAKALAGVGQKTGSLDQYVFAYSVYYPYPVIYEVVLPSLVTCFGTCNSCVAIDRETHDALVYGQVGSSYTLLRVKLDSGVNTVLFSSDTLQMNQYLSCTYDNVHHIFWVVAYDGGANVVAGIDTTVGKVAFEVKHDCNTLDYDYVTGLTYAIFYDNSTYTVNTINSVTGAITKLATIEPTSTAAIDSIGRLLTFVSYDPVTEKTLLITRNLDMFMKLWSPVCGPKGDYLVCSQYMDYIESV